MSYVTPNNSLRRSIAFMKHILLAAALAITPDAAERGMRRSCYAPPAERGMSASSRALPPQELVVTSNLTDQEVDPSFSITLNLSRPLQAAEGRVAVLIGQTDFTNLFALTGNGLSYLPRIVPLPAGESPVRVFLVSPSNEWRELMQLTLRVKTAPPADATPGQPGEQAQKPSVDHARPGAATKYSCNPSLAFGMKSEV